MPNRILKNAFGFTLMELVLVLSLVAIMSFAAIPAIMNVQMVTLDGATRKLEGDLRYAQSLSLTTGDSYGLRTTGGAGGTAYEVYKVADDSIVSSPYDHNPMQEDFTTAGEEYKGITFPDSDTITFDDTGNPTIVAGDGIITLNNSNNESKDVVVSNSGLINIQ